MADLALLTGAGGFLATEISGLRSDVEIVPLTRAQLDIADRTRVRDCIQSLRPSFIINCAAFRDIDKAESEAAAARRVNVEGPRVLAECSAEFGIKLIHFSTHGIFDGKKTVPYVESDPPGPLNTYAATKLEGEEAIRKVLPPDQWLILRISWPYGLHGNNFIHAILAAGKTRSEVRVVADQTGTPNPVSLIAQRTLQILREGQGVFHLSCKGSCSRYDFIALLFRELKLACEVLPVSSDAFPTIAKRPQHIAIGTEIAWLDRLAPMPSWQEAFAEFLGQSRNRKASQPDTK